MNIAEKTVLVTGGNRRIGEAIPQGIAVRLGNPSAVASTAMLSTAGAKQLTAARTRVSVDAACLSLGAMVFY
jgi:NAD(P)-dependent dehydrogenase (short-subunit alcohol dehydrogenase family)